MLSDRVKPALQDPLRVPGLKSPFGARCFLTFPVPGSVVYWHRNVLMYLMVLGAFWREQRDYLLWFFLVGLNAPFGARCFLTVSKSQDEIHEKESLNAPFGARCFLTIDIYDHDAFTSWVLMHLMALGAF